MERSFIINLGALEDIALGHGRSFIVKDTEIAVFRLRNGDIVAIENKCPHRQGPLSEGLVDQNKVICPIHGYKFDLTTGQGIGNNECVRVFDTWVEHENIYLQYSPYTFIDGKMTSSTHN